MSERAASQPPPPSLPLEELAHSDEAYILLLVRRGLLLPDTTKTWHFNLLPVTSLVPLGGFSRAPSYHLLVGKNTFRKSCSLALLLQEGQEKQEERRSSGRRLWLRTEQATSPAKPSNGGGGGPQHLSCSLQTTSPNIRKLPLLPRCRQGPGISSPTLLHRGCI